MVDEKMNVGTRIKSFVGQCNRVWHLLKKPDKEEFTTDLLKEMHNKG